MKRWMELFFATGTALLLGACGNDMSGLRGSFGVANVGSDSTSTQSLTGLSCTATPSKVLVASEESFTVTVNVYGATGSASVPGASGSGSSFVKTVSFKNTYDGDVYWQGSITARDSSGSATCIFRVLVQTTSVRHL